MLYNFVLFSHRCRGLTSRDVTVFTAGLHYNNAPRGRSQRGMTLLYKIENMYTLMKNKAHIHHKQPRILYYTHPTFPAQKNKRNFSTATSRVRASPSRNHCGFQLPAEPEGKSADYTMFRWPRPPYRCCRHNSSLPLLPSQQLRRYPR